MNQEVWDRFFTAKTAEEAVEILEHEEGADMIHELMQVADGSHPYIVAAKNKLERIDDDGPGRGWGDLIQRLMVSFPQRLAAIRMLSRSIEIEPATFQFLWEVAQGRNTGTENVANFRYEALKSLAVIVPVKEYARFFLAQYRAPYNRRKLEGSSRTYADTRSQATAGIILLAAFPKCDSALQEEIKKTVKFEYRKDSIECAETPYKYSDHPDAAVRHYIISMLYSLYFDRGFAHTDTSAFKDAFRDHFLKELLATFCDDASVYGEEIFMAMHWCGEKAVIDACCDYLEQWGGMFLQEDSTVYIVSELMRLEVPVTPRLIAVMETLYHKPMDAEFEDERPPYSHIGSFSARRIRDAITEWKKKKLPQAA